MPDLSAKQSTAIQTLIKRLCPSLAGALSEQLHVDVELDLVDQRTVSLSELLGRSEHVLQTLFTLSQPEGSESVLVLSEESARIIVDMMEGMSGGDPTEPLTDSNVDTLSGGMSALVRAFCLNLSALTGDHYELESSSTHFGMLTVPPVFALEGSAIEATFTLTIPDVGDVTLTALFTTALMLEIAPTSDSRSADGERYEAGGALTEDDVAAMLGQAVGGVDYRPGAPVPTIATGPGAASPFPELSDQGSHASSHRGLGMILDIPLDVTVELGRVRMLIKDVLELSSGSIIELDRVAGEPVDLLVNGRLVAKGEVVVIEDNFGIRITEIMSPTDRVAGLGRGDRR